MRILCAIISVVFVLFLMSGCATGARNVDLENQGLRNQIALLDAQVQAKDEEISNLKANLAKVEQEANARPVVKETSMGQVVAVAAFVRPSVKQVQLALKNAGYYSGRIDGVMGARSRLALKAFQKANNLPAKGKINKKSWELLKGYLDNAR